MPKMMSKPATNITEHIKPRLICQRIVVNTMMAPRKSVIGGRIRQNMVANISPAAEAVDVMRLPSAPEKCWLK